MDLPEQDRALLSPAFYPSVFTRNELIVYYSLCGLPVADIQKMLREVHGYGISARQLIRVRTALNVGRRSQNETPMPDVIAAIQREFTVSGNLLGYRSMCKRLNTSYGLCVRRDTVMMLLSLMNPSATESRKKRRLQRRVYRSKGPNFVWHMDGYDKLKPFGITLHGCIDGYSRRIMWARVAHSNNNPNIIAQYYMDCIETVGGCPSIVRADRGTENSIVAFLQPALRHTHTDDYAQEKSFQYGRSSANQRIEAWWSYLRSHMTDWWIDYFKDLQINGYFDNTLQHNIDALRYSFGPVVQKQLSDLVLEWNHHRIRNTATAEAPGGIPEVLYHLPSSTGVEDYKHLFDTDLLTDAKEEYSYTGYLLVEDSYKVYADSVCADFGLTYPPITHEEALLMFLLLKDDGNLFS